MSVVKPSSLSGGGTVRFRLELPSLLAIQQFKGVPTPCQNEALPTEDTKVQAEGINRMFCIFETYV